MSFLNEDLFVIVAQSARYIYVILILLIVFRAVRGLLIDARRVNRLRHMLPTTGLCGEMVVINGGERAVKGMRYPVIREGTIGSGRGCDIRIRHSTVRKKHATFQMTGNGLRIQCLPGRSIFNEMRRLQNVLELEDGALFSIGHVEMKLALNYAESAALGSKFDGDGNDHYEDDGDFDLRDEREEPEEPEIEDLFDTEYRPAPTRRPAPRTQNAPFSRRGSSEPYDWFDDEE